MVGLSGAGKSTMLKLIIGEDRVDEGKILIDNIDLATISKEDIPYLRRKIGVVFQDMKLLQKRTAFENVALPWRFAVCPSKKSRKTCRKF